MNFTGIDLSTLQNIVNVAKAQKAQVETMLTTYKLQYNNCKSKFGLLQNSLVSAKSTVQDINTQAQSLQEQSAMPGFLKKLDIPKGAASLSTTLCASASTTIDFS